MGSQRITVLWIVAYWFVTQFHWNKWDFQVKMLKMKNMQFPIMNVFDWSGGIHLNTDSINKSILLLFVKIFVKKNILEEWKNSEVGTVGSKVYLYWKRFAQESRHLGRCRTMYLEKLQVRRYFKNVYAGKKTNFRSATVELISNADNPFTIPIPWKAYDSCLKCREFPVKLKPRS